MKNSYPQITSLLNMVDFTVKKKQMITFVFIIACNFSLFSQNIGINATGSTPNVSAGLDIDFSNKGLLIPRVSLTSVNDVITIPTPTLSLLVFNNDSAGTAPNNVVPGFYYWNGIKWIPFVSTNNSSRPSQWGTIASTNMTWVDCNIYCSNSTEGGYTDWYMPSLAEWYELNAIVTAGSSTSYCWTASTSNIADSFFAIQQSTGNYGASWKLNLDKCRCIR
ncbi:MAG: hypothetical protein JNM51_17525 [Bacteroidia bacterium]|nr:hypothetical protein [Bacteroidia bacterium]